MSRSKEEAIAAGVKVRDTQHTMKRRKPWHKYHRKGTYMITIVVDGRRPVLGRLVIPPAVDAAGVGAAVGVGAAAGVEDVARVRGDARGDARADARAAGDAAGAYVELTPLGRAIRDEEVKKISAIYKEVEIWKLCIMPDHIHLIARITEDLPDGKHLGHIVAGFKGGCSRAWWRQVKPCADAQGVVAATTPTALAVGTGSAAGIPPLFEAGYNDLILLDDGQLDNWKHYLDDNPRRLAIKRLHPEFFTTINYADIAEWHCQIVGNSFLLMIPQKVAVIVHSAYTDKDFADYREKWLACGEAGGVLVSAAIATREKEVMREAMNRGYRLIFVRENGFPPLYKPSGESFEACSDGRLLQVSPWEYHMEHRRISREKCLKLNRLVEEIVNEGRKESV